MILTDGKIKELAGSSLIRPFDELRVQSVCYDLTAEVFYSDAGRDLQEYNLDPMSSVFVRCKEEISLPDNLCAKIILRNSRIRQGMTIDAPLYYPGHKTPVYFRVTNLTSKRISLHAGDGLASIVFEELIEKVQKPYDGTFQKEDLYKGMGTYADVYAKDMKDIEEKNRFGQTY